MAVLPIPGALVERRHEGDGRRSRALYSPCGAYRYLLERIWEDGERLLYLLLNPSTATEVRNDATLARCERRARALGYGGFAVANLFAFRATRPAELRRAAEPVGAENDAVLLGAARDAGAVLCGWGTHGAYRGRGAEVAAMLATGRVRLTHLGLTGAGQPRHPLYVPHALAPADWRP